MAVNTLTRGRLRRLADVHPEHGRVLSVFMNLDPSEVPTPKARSSAVTSVLTEAARRVDEAGDLDHDERQDLRADIDSVREVLTGTGVAANGARAVAVFACRPADLLEVVSLRHPLESRVVLDDSPYVEPLVHVGAAERWCVLLANRRAARLFVGDGDELEETDRIEDDVHRRHDQGGWSQANYQRSIDKDAVDHLRHVAKVAFAHLQDDPPVGILVGAPSELAGEFEGHLHPYLRERLAGRLDIDVEHTSADDVRRAAAPHIEDAARAREDAALARLAEAFGGGSGRAASGVPEVLAAVHEQRVEILLVEAGFATPGVLCPTCGWLGTDEATTCPADGSATERLDDLVEAAVERTLTQAADVRVLRDRAELASHGRVAAVLRF